VNAASALQIVRLTPLLEASLAAFFHEIEHRGDRQQFHPHGFTAEDAKRICRYAGRDLYVVVEDAQEILGYGMLRGWDAGYAVPSLGIYVRAEMRRMGLGRLLMLYLHAAARLRGASKIRLKVYPNNAAARRLYEQLGYEFAEHDGDQIVGYVALGHEGRGG
jgi:ribosomal protein S18 acetylase RimI-like enzyme